MHIALFFRKLARVLKCIWHEPIASYRHGLRHSSSPKRCVEGSNLIEGLQTQKRQ